MAAGLALMPAAARAQTATQIHGVVRDSAGHPIARAEASVERDSGLAVANDSGVFTIVTHRPRDIVLHVRHLGYEPVDREVVLGDSGSVAVTITMAAIPQSMATFHVVAARTGVWGVVRTPWGAPIPGAEVEILGTSAPGTISDSSGAFTLPTQHAGTYIVVARKKGYAYAQTSVTLQPDAGDEAEVVLHPLTKPDDMASGYGRMQYVFRETSTRLAFKSSSASVVTHDELLRNGAETLAYALCGTSALQRAGQRCPARAGCVIVNGDRTTALPLEAFDVSDVESVEFYPPRSDWSNTLRYRGCGVGANVAVVWLRAGVR